MYDEAGSALVRGGRRCFRRVRQLGRRHRIQHFDTLTPFLLGKDGSSAGGCPVRDRLRVTRQSRGGGLEGVPRRRPWRRRRSVLLRGVLVAFPTLGDRPTPPWRSIHAGIGGDEVSGSWPVRRPLVVSTSIRSRIEVHGPRMTWPNEAIPGLQCRGHAGSRVRVSHNEPSTHLGQ